MNEKEIKEDLITWMKDFVEKPHPSLGNWSPCPYARQARMNDKIDIVFADPNYLQFVVREQTLKLDTYEAIIIAMNHKDIGPKQLAKSCNDWNSNWLMNEDYVLLEDHPETVEHVNGVHMNFGKCALVILQKLSKLNEASETLARKGYYDVWGDAEKNFVVDWRFNK